MWKFESNWTTICKNPSFDTYFCRTQKKHVKKLNAYSILFIIGKCNLALFCFLRLVTLFELTNNISAFNYSTWVLCKDINEGSCGFESQCFIWFNFLKSLKAESIFNFISEFKNDKIRTYRQTSYGSKYVQ